MQFSFYRSDSFLHGERFSLKTENGLEREAYGLQLPNRKKGQLPGNFLVKKCDLPKEKSEEKNLKMSAKF